MCFLASDATARIAVEAVPLSEMMPPGRPRIATILSSSHADARDLHAKTYIEGRTGKLRRSPENRGPRSGP